MNDRDDLRARLAAVREGDEVTVTMKDYRDRPVATLTGEVEESDTGALRVWIVVLRDVDGEPGHFVLSLDSHTPATPPEPEQPAVYVEDPPIRNRTAAARADERRKVAEEIATDIEYLFPKTGARAARIARAHAEEES